MSRLAPALPLAALLALLPATAALAHGPGLNHKPSWLGTVTSKTYDGISDDLLTAGLGKGGLQVPLSLVGLDPTDPAVIRRVAIHTNYRAIVDTTAGGGFGTLYGPNVQSDGTVTAGDGKIAGSEYIAYADDRDGGPNVTMMVQVPASFDPKRPCIVTGTSSGSRGVYGAIGSSGEWGMKRGCAVAYTDKGTGNGIHDLQANTVSLQNGVRADAAAAGDGSNFTARLTDLQRQTFNAATPNRFAVKHAHSQRNPEREWGRDTLRAVEFAFWVLNEQFGRKLNDGRVLRTITKRDTIVIASSVSNGAGAALAAAEEDRDGLIDGVAVSEPNIQVGFAPHPVIRRGSLVYREGSRPLYDYFTFANLYQPCAARSTRAAGSPLPINPLLAASMDARCASLAQSGLLATTTLAAQYEEAMDRLLAYGWEADTVLLHSSHWSLATPSITMTYSNAHGRFAVADNLCGLSFAATDATGAVSAVTPGALPFSFSLGNGVPPTVGINMVFNDAVGGARNLFLSTSPSTNRADFGFDTALCQRDLWAGRNLDALRVRVGIAEVQKRGDLNGKPAIIVHGRSDTLVPVNFSSRPYYAENQRRERGGSRLRYIEVTNAQHFDAFLPFPGFDARFVPLHVYFNRALDAMWAHLTARTPLPPSQVVRTTPRGAPVAPAVVAPPISAANVPPIAANPPAADRITYSGSTLSIPD
jgi:hydroxybutyrate-dimer hydrolase